MRVREQIEAAQRAHAEALAQHDPAALAAFYEEDAVILAPATHPVAGAGAIRAYCEGLCALPYDFDVPSFTIEHVLATGDYVIAISCRSGGTAPIGEPAAREISSTKALVVWRYRQGRWLIAREMFSDIER